MRAAPLGFPGHPFEFWRRGRCASTAATATSPVGGADAVRPAADEAVVGLPVSGHLDELLSQPPAGPSRHRRDSTGWVQGLHVGAVPTSGPH
jgi:hypothetical protein